MGAVSFAAQAPEDLAAKAVEVAEMLVGTYGLTAVQYALND